MRNPHGYVLNGSVEMDTVQCIHCGKHTPVKAGAQSADDSGWCQNCMGVVCAQCCGETCEHFMRKIERSEARGRLARSAGIV